jgi:RNA recognition motif-containing protein
MSNFPFPERRHNSDIYPHNPYPLSPSTRPPRTFLPSELRTPIHTIFLHNLDFNVTYDEVYRFCERYGPIKVMFYPLTKPGMALCTYFDLRDAERAVKEGMSRPIRSRPVKTNFGFKPPPHAKRNLKEICSTILARSTAEASRISFAEMKSALGAFGEIRSAEERPEGIVLKFYDLRAAEKCDQEKWVTIKGEKVTLEYLETEDLGDEMIELAVPPPPPKGYQSYQPYPYEYHRGYQQKQERSETEYQQQNEMMTASENLRIFDPKVVFPETPSFLAPAFPDDEDEREEQEGEGEHEQEGGEQEQEGGEEESRKND